MTGQKTTTIKLGRETKKRLDKLKEHEKESYDFVINKALNILNICRSNPSLSYRILRDIERTKKRREQIEFNIP